ncbi:MAG TPA: CopG family transcriptional regulator [Candidatus Sulfotelmatobacter sp.]|nr:CopG family transcriptional regulator [Candidatus Sulfotelmatobacter sp.]
MRTHKTVQIVLDKRLLEAVDNAAKRIQQTPSALVREALREHLARLQLRASEDRDRQGYSRQPQTNSETKTWESHASWPE